MPTEASPQPSLQDVHGDCLNKLLTTVDAIKMDLNDEIRVAIGTVQVRDARATITQTNMAVVLTIMAVLYLPLTLVTGIFGMNVREISRVPGNLGAWWVAVVWAVIVLLTMGSGLLVWKVWKFWTARKARKQALDIETGHEGHEISESLGRRAKNWGCRLNQKAKKFVRRKEE